MKTPTDLQTILKELHNISGFRISIHDTRRNEIAAYPQALSGFCGFLQSHKGVRSICQENDAQAFAKVKESGEVYFYRCPFGLNEAIAPLYQFGELTGYLMMGQTLDVMEDSRSLVYRQAKPFVQDLHRLNQLIEEIPGCSREKMSSCIAIMRICAEYLTLTNRINLSDRSLAHAVKGYLTENYTQKLSIETLCRLFFCSPPTLMGTFKKAYGKTVNQYLTELRLSRAKELLQGSASIKEIAEATGFSDQNYFSKVFFKQVGISPSRYRTKQPVPQDSLS